MAGARPYSDHAITSLQVWLGYELETHRLRTRILVPPEISSRKGPNFHPCSAAAFFFFFFITLGLELSDTKVYEP